VSEEEREDVRGVSDLTTKGALTAITELPTEEKKDVADTAVQTLPAEAQKDVATSAVQTLPIEDQKDVAAAAASALPPELKKTIAAGIARELSPEDRADLAERLPFLVPTQRVTNRIWQWIVGAFAVVLVLGAVALFIGALVSEELQILLTVVTTVAGILASFVSGRASSGESST